MYIYICLKKDKLKREKWPSKKPRKCFTGGTVDGVREGKRGRAGG